YPRHFRWLLRHGANAEQKERGTKREADDGPLKINGCHLITRSALARIFGGIVRPICLDVLRLITSSNFIGCSMGRSAGLAPFKILSTYTAARRQSSRSLDPYDISPAA